MLSSEFFEISENTLFHRTPLVPASVYSNPIHGNVFIYQPYSLSFTTNRSDRLEVFCKIGALKNYAKFTRKHQCQSVFYDKVFFLKRDFGTGVFWWIFKNSFFIEHLLWLLLDKIITVKKLIPTYFEDVSVYLEYCLLHNVLRSRLYLGEKFSRDFWTNFKRTLFTRLLAA